MKGAFRISRQLIYFLQERKLLCFQCIASRAEEVECLSVFEEDRKKYDAFIDPSTLLTRLEKAEYGILHEAFRTQGADGTYIWMSHRLLLVPNAGSRQILYVIHTMDEKDLSREASAEKGNRDMAYFVSLMRHIPLPVFWKDRERSCLRR